VYSVHRKIVLKFMRVAQSFHFLPLCKMFKRFLAAHIILFMSVRLSAWQRSAPTGQIFIKFHIWAFVENMSRKSDRNDGWPTLQADVCNFTITSPTTVLQWQYLTQNLWRKSKHILCWVTLSPEWCCLRDYLERYWRERDVADANMAQALCMLDN
jgi:hypothetical protein